MQSRLLPIKYMLLFIFSIAVLYPLLIVFFGALKTSADLFNNPYGFPKEIIFDNFPKALLKGNMLNYYQNSIIVSAVSIFFILLFSSMAAFMVTRRNLRGSASIYYYFMLGLAVPAQVLMVPSYLLMSKLHLINNLASLMIVYVSTALSFSIFILSGFFKTIPYEVEEAAAIDGCNPFQIFSKVIMPLGKPALSTIMIFNLLTIWNDFYNPLLYIRDDRLKTVTLGLTNYMGRYVANYPTMFAAVLLASLPVIIVFIILQKQFVSGITAGSLKG